MKRILLLLLLISICLISVTAQNQQLSLNSTNIPIASSFRMPIGGDIGEDLNLLTIDSFNNFNYPKVRFNENGNNRVDPNEWYVATAFNQNRYLNNGWNKEPFLNG